MAFDFTRASSATVVNKAGLIETVGSGEPRIDFSNDVNGALLLEPTRSNQMINSEDLTGWTIQAGATVTLESINNPVNSTNANLITANTNGAYQNRTTPDVSASYSVSFWLHKNNESGTIQLTNAQGGNFGNWTINLDLLQNDFVRITRDHPSVTAVSEWATIASGDIAPFFKSPTGTKSFYVTGFQLEPSYATSYIPTQGSTVTRLAESNVQDLSNVVSLTEGVIYIDTTNLGKHLNSNIISHHSVTDTVYCLKIDSSNKIAMGLFASGVNVPISSASAYPLGARTKIALHYKSGDMSLYINGSLEGTNGTSFTLGSGFASALRLIDATTVYHSYPSKSIVSDFRIYNTALTDSELQALTTI